MPRKPRIVIPGLPHHVTHRGTRRQTVFFETADYLEYKSILGAACEEYGIEIWAYCFMPNHIHVIAVPSTEAGLSKAFGIAHKNYARFMNRKKDWRGHLWEDRFGSVAMDERHLYAAARYVELNPVRAKLVFDAPDYRWSSVHAHMYNRDDSLVVVAPLLERYGNWQQYLGLGLDDNLVVKFRRHEKSGQCLHRRNPGPKPKNIIKQ